MARKKPEIPNPAKRGKSPKRAQAEKVDEVAITERQNQAVAMRRSGGSLRAIAAKLGISHEQVRKDIQVVMAEVIAEAKDNAAELRALEIEHLEELRLRMMTLLDEEKAITDPIEKRKIKLGTVDRLVRISERRAKLLGIDAPDKHEVAHTYPSFSDIMNGKKPDDE